MRGASIGCCAKKCRKSFHFSCGIKNKCLSEFIGHFRSYCHIHFATNTLNTEHFHGPDELCNLCEQPMQEHDPVTSLQFSCCSSDKWFHKRCLKQHAHTLGDNFKCPLCQNVDEFRENMQLNGIYIPESSSVAQYNSDDDFDAAPPPQPKRRRVHKQWIFGRTFESKKEAEELMKDKWSYHYPTGSENGRRVVYRCPKVKFRGPQCDAAAYLRFDSKSGKVQLFIADCEHTHENSANAVEEIPDDVKKVIEDLFENNVTTPKLMTTNLLKKNIELPLDAKLKTFLKHLHKAKYGKSRIHCGTLEKWLEENTALPDDASKPFILNYEMNCEDETNVDFRFIATTTTLLKLAVGQDTIHTDATYKITWQGFPLLLVGTTDLYRSFHPFGVAVCTTEQQKDFEFIFASVKQGVENTFDEKLEPKYLIADAAKAIHNAGLKVFGPDLSVLMCWFYMRKAVSEKLPTFIRDPIKQAQFLNDLDKLQLAKSIEIFEVALKLFLEKWNEESTEFIDYFKKQWIEQNPNWFEGFAKLVPSTNNSVESKNRIIKDEHTIRERMDLGKFRVALFDMLHSWSLAYIDGKNVVHSEAPEITLKLWTDGYNWAKEKIKIKSSRRDSKIIYRSSTADTIDDSFDWPNFDSFKKTSFEFYDTSFAYPITRENWHSGQCDCGEYFKLFICRHIIGITLRMKIIAAPAEAKNVPIGQKRKPGRPAKAKPALVRQK